MPIPFEMPTEIPTKNPPTINGEDISSETELEDADLTQVHSLSTDDLVSLVEMEDSRVTTILPQPEKIVSESFLEDVSGFSQVHILSIDNTFSETELEDGDITQVHILGTDKVVALTDLEEYTVSPVPAEPDNLTVNRAADRLSTALSWDSVDQADDYVIYRSNDEQSTYTQIATTSNTSYTDSHNDDETNFSYKVAARIQNAIGRKTIAQHTPGKEASVPR